MKNLFKTTLLSALTSAFALSLIGCNSTSPLTTYNQNTLNSFQASNITKNTNAWDFREESIYFVMTDRYVDGDKSNNNIYGDEYQPGNLKYYQGGDFKGLMENLDHIKDMGFTSIWITPPVMQPPGRYISNDHGYDGTGYHGYWAWDFSKIDKHLESPGYTYQDFINAAHAKGLKVVQDIVANHAHGDATNPEVKWHNDRGKVFGLGLMFDYLGDSTKSSTSFFHRPYANTTRAPWFNHNGPKIADLIDINENNPATAQWLCDIYKNYQNMGVDAFRIDTVAWMNQSFWTKFTDEMHKNKPNFFMFGEAWTNAAGDWLASYTKVGTLPGDTMNSGMSVLDMPGSSMGTWGQFERVFKGNSYNEVDNVLNNDPKYKDSSYLVTYLDNHDKPRFNGSGNDGSTASTEQYIDGINWYFTARGIPCMYYGTEVQMQGGNDPDNRKVLGTEGIQQAKNNSVYKQMKRLNAIRKSSVALQKGKQTKLFGSQHQYSFKREFGNDIAVVALNKDWQQSTITINNVPNGKYTDLTTGSPVEITNNSWTPTIASHELKVIALGQLKGSPWTIKSWKSTATTKVTTTAIKAKTTIKR